MLNRPFALAAALLSVCGAVGAAAPPQPPLVEAPEPTGLGLTVYHDGQALVRDSRRVALSAGMQRLELREVAVTMRPETVSLRAVSGAPCDVLEQSFDFEPLTPAALLHRYVGKSVTVIRTNPATGAETPEPATVLSDKDGVVLRYRDRIETGVPGRLAFSDVPADLGDRPKLSVLLHAAQAGERQLELTYVAGGIGWKADYSAMLDAQATRMTLTGWATLSNQSGAAFHGARLQLVAGTLNRLPTAIRPMAAAAAFAQRADAVPEERLADYHLYTLPRAISLEPGQTLQVALVTAKDVPVRREYVLQNDQGSWWYEARRPEAQKGLKPVVTLRFDNRGELGLPLPAGIVRAYMADRSGAIQWIGEDRMANTARGEPVSVRLGDAFDLTADRVQTDFQTLSRHSSQSSFRIELRNADAAPATVIVREVLHGDWKITSETLPHETQSAGSAAWSVPVPANGTAVLEYTAVFSW